MSETEMKQTEARSTGGESTGEDEIEMAVVKVGSLPEKFRPSPSGRAPATGDVPRPLAELIWEATSGLSGPEREVFLRRLRKEHPGLFSGKSGEDSQQLSKEPTGEFSEKEFSEEQFSKEEWREELTRLLKEEANRFMAAAAGL
ncbi:hypothetical protein GGQ11_002921 [Salinibacter ruber]|uniref:hypothetical protein n=1 Tax=Salinibacter ruber TaxID=146919 RepID=UPI00216A141E|nr:hypothetical protein [Salinibacter ruber]MCS3658120.1 hypothetical protein [Salinibacter ruber]MCS3824023.1 hypothetical protein [Salinibacter ruber]